jgi:site-specific DNA-methyltransferase (adenine-specific)
MTLSRGLFTSCRENWKTPEVIYRRFVPPAFDVSDRHGGTFDALKDPWPEPWYCNPPYGREIPHWTARMIGEGVALVPSRTDTRWWHDDIMARAERIEFIRGRLHFDGLGPAPFPSALIFFAKKEAP